MGHSVRQTVHKLPLAERFADTTRVLQVLAEPDSHDNPTGHAVRDGSRSANDRSMSLMLVGFEL